MREKTWEEDVDEMLKEDDIDDYSKEIIKLSMYNVLLEDANLFLLKLDKDLGKVKFNKFTKMFNELRTEISSIIKQRIDNVDLDKVRIPDSKDEDEFEENEFLEEIKS